VRKQTGHPPDLLDIDLEADLGIDAIKRSRSVRQYSRRLQHIERDDAFNLGDYPTSARWRCPLTSAVEPIRSAMSGS
jgi:hypothetical protein